VFFGAPTGYAGMLAAADLTAQPQVKLRLCSSAGEALPREIGERFTAHFGCEIVDGLGSTEMPHIFLSNRPGDVEYGSTGRVVPGHRLKLVDEDGFDAKVGEIGDLYVAGPSSALMYLGASAKNLGPRSRASGPRPTTNIRSTRGAATYTPAAATTC
jgi:benzoate-CoA ligase